MITTTVTTQTLAPQCLRGIDYIQAHGIPESMYLPMGMMAVALLLMCVVFGMLITMLVQSRCQQRRD